MKKQRHTSCSPFPPLSKLLSSFQPGVDFSNDDVDEAVDGLTVAEAEVPRLIVFGGATYTERVEEAIERVTKRIEPEYESHLRACVEGLGDDGDVNAVRFAGQQAAFYLGVALGLRIGGSR